MVCPIFIGSKYSENFFISNSSSRGLTRLTKGIRKIDETSGIKGPLPHQLGYLENLQELYARRVGIYGPIPKVDDFYWYFD